MQYLSRRIFISLFVLVALAGCVAAHAAANQPIYDFRLGQAAFGPGPARPIGSMAPDFSLPMLTSYLPEGKPAQVQTMRLASFRGKKSVVLLFTGHT